MRMPKKTDVRMCFKREHFIAAFVFVLFYVCLISTFFSLSLNFFKGCIGACKGQ